MDSLFLLLWLPPRDFCSLFLLLWLSFRNFRWIFREKKQLAWKTAWKSKFAAATFEPSILITFYHWKFVAGTGGLTQVCSQVCSLIMSLMHLLLISIDADMKVALDVTKWPCPSRFHVKEASADAELIQHVPLRIAYHCRHPISTIPVARITANATVPSLKHTDFKQFDKTKLVKWTKWMIFVYKTHVADLALNTGGKKTKLSQ